MDYNRRFASAKEAESFIGSYCGRCRREEKCEAYLNLQSALEGNKLFWDGLHFVPKRKEQPEVACRRFKK